MMLQRLLGWLLHRANARPPEYVRETFYRLKSRLLVRYGRYIGDDVQDLSQECWGPDRRSYVCPGNGCPKCGGTGVYRERFVVLERWRLGRYTFHRPVERRLPKMVPVRVIKGIIRHGDVPYDQAVDALLWLALVYDRELFRRVLRGTAFWKTRRPMLWIQGCVYVHYRDGDRMRATIGDGESYEEVIGRE